VAYEQAIRLDPTETLYQTNRAKVVRR
jgi:hypothetical protein